MFAAEILRPSDDYARTGYVGPIKAISAAEAGMMAKEVFAGVGASIQKRGRVVGLIDSLLGRKTKQVDLKYNRHLNWAPIRTLALNDSILSAVESILGPDILIWRSNIFCQHATEADGLPWHRDKYGNVLKDVSRQVSLQVALTETTADNCLELIPGSHAISDPELIARYGSGTPSDLGNSIRYNLTVTGATKAAMKPGEFILFHPDTVHRSSVSPAKTAPRMCVTLRYTSAGNVNKSKWPYALVRGTAAPQEGMLDWT